MRKNDRGGSKRGGLSIYRGGRMVPPKVCRFLTVPPYIYVQKKHTSLPLPFGEGCLRSRRGGVIPFIYNKLTVFPPNVLFFGKQKTKPPPKGGP